MTERQAPYIHPNCPPKLAALYKDAECNARAVARVLKINIYYVSRAILHGERPSNKTIAKALYFPREYNRREAREPKPEAPAWLQWWRSLKREERAEYIRQNYEDDTSTIGAPQ